MADAAPLFNVAGLASGLETQAPLDAAYSIDGTPHTSASNVAMDGLAGVTLTLKGVTSTRR